MWDQFSGRINQPVTLSIPKLGMSSQMEDGVIVTHQLLTMMMDLYHTVESSKTQTLLTKERVGVTNVDLFKICPMSLLPTWPVRLRNSHSQRVELLLRPKIFRKYLFNSIKTNFWQSILSQELTVSNRLTRSTVGDQKMDMFTRRPTLKSCCTQHWLIHLSNICNNLRMFPTKLSISTVTSFKMLKTTMWMQSPGVCSKEEKSFNQQLLIHKLSSSGRTRLWNRLLRHGDPYTNPRKINRVMKPEATINPSSTLKHAETHFIWLISLTITSLMETSIRSCWISLIKTKN